MAAAQFDLIAIGTGAAASAAAYKCRIASWRVAVVDSRPFGGTCQLRGCDPKKVLVRTGVLIDAIRRMSGKGIKGDGAHIHWPELMRFKRTFTDPAPRRTEDGFRKAGMDTFHGAASFAGPSSIRVGADLLEAKHVLIATGAKPQRLNIPGEEHFTTSDQFLELDSLPRRVIFIGGDYISFEFAHLSARAGSQVTVLHRGERPLEAFDCDLVQRLLQKTRELGIHVELRAQATAIEGRANQLVVTASTPQGPRRFEAAMVVHGSGRVADLDELNLGAPGYSSTASS